MGNIRILCIAGGSGAGKTTLAEGLAERLGDSVSVLHLDDYQKTKGHVPLTVSGRRNYDHPDAVDFPRFVRDLVALGRGEDVTLTRRDKRATMDAGVLVGTTIVVPARPLVVVEGYLALWYPDARMLYDLAVFLDLPHDERLARRRWAKDPQYVEEVLVPMHEAYVEPTKSFADLVIAVAGRTPDDILEFAVRSLALILPT